MFGMHEESPYLANTHIGNKLRYAGVAGCRAEEVQGHHRGDCSSFYFTILPSVSGMDFSGNGETSTAGLGPGLNP